MPDPFLDPFARMMSAGSFAPSSYASLFGQGKGPTTRDILPQYSPQEEQGFFGRATDNALGGLSYLGDILDKTFMGRGIRGALGGKPQELLSVLPFSDTLGITSMDDRVSGRDLLSNLGVTSPHQQDEDFSTDDLLGLGAELALDPSTYLSPLGLTKAGMAAAKLGKGVGGLERGFAKQIASGQRGLTFHVPLSGTLTGTEGIGGTLLSGQPYLDAASTVRSGATLPTRGIDYAINALTGYKPLQGAQGVGNDILQTIAPLFNKSLKNSTDAAAQGIAKGTSEFEATLKHSRQFDEAGQKLAFDALAGPEMNSPAWAKEFEAIKATKPDADSAVEYAAKYGEGPTAENVARINAAIVQKAELANQSEKAAAALKDQARENAADAISKWHRPVEDTDNIKNLLEWKNSNGDIPLNPVNEQYYKSSVSPLDDVYLSGQLPNGAPIPTDARQLTTLEASRDLINQGHIPSFTDDILKLKPSDALLQKDRQAIAEHMLADETHGPRSLVDPGGVDNRMYRDEINQWVNDPKADLNDVLFHGDYGDLAQQSVDKLSGTDSYNRLLNGGELKFNVPRSQKHVEWAEKNLTDFQKPLFNGLVEKTQTFLKNAIEVSQQAGSDISRYNNDLIDYVTRQAQKYPLGDPRANFDSLAKDFKERYTADSKFMRQREELFDGIIGGSKQFDEWAMDPKLSGKARDTVEGAMTKEQRQAYLREQLTGMEFPSKGNPAIKQAEQLEDFLGSLPAQHAEKGVPFWSADLPTTLNARGRARDKVLSVAQARDLAYKIARPMADFEKEGTPAKTMKDLADALGLTGTDAQGAISARKLAEQEGTRLGIPLLAEKELYKLKDLEGYGISEKTFNDIVNFDKSFKTPAVLEPVLKAIDYATNLFKTWVTTPWLAFMQRNNMQYAHGTFRGGALQVTPEGLARMDKIKNFLRGSLDEVIPGVSRDQFYKEAVAGDLAFNYNAGARADMLGKGGEVVRSGNLRVPQETGQSMATDVLSRLYQEGKDVVADPSKLNPLKDGSQSFPLVKVMNEANQHMREFWQLNHYATLREQGWTAEAAAADVRRYHHDYSQLSDAERGIARRIFPWYCMPVDHEILTRDGWKFYGQIAEGDLVMGFDHLTQELRWVPLLEVCEFDYDGELCVYECRGASFEFTPDHRWPVQFSTDKRWEILPANEINATHTIPLIGKYRQEESILSPRHAAILGWILTDGYMRWPCGNYCEAIIYQSEAKFDAVLRKLLGTEPRLASDDRQFNKVYTYQVSREDSLLIASVCPTKKDASSIIGQLSREAAEAMFDAMMMAEGTESGTGQKHFAQSPKNWFVSDAFQMLCVMTERPAFRSAMGCYLRKSNSIHPRNWKRDPIQYQGKIWCPRTETGTWVVRHNGAVAITGNTFTRNILPPVLQDLVEKPGVITAPYHAMTGIRQKGDFVPSYIGEGTNIPLGTDESGNRNYLTSAGLGIEDENFKMLGSLLHGDLSRASEIALGATMPYIKAPLEFAFDKQLFSGRKLEDLRPYNWASLGGLLDEKQARQLTELVAQSPASRGASFGSTLLDERKTPFDLALNNIFGIRTNDVNYSSAVNNAEIRMMEDLLRGTPGARTHESLYFPKESLPNLTPEQAQAYSMLLAASKRAQDAANLKKKMAGQ